VQNERSFQWLQETDDKHHSTKLQAIPRFFKFYLMCLSVIRNCHPQATCVCCRRHIVTHRAKLRSQPKTAPCYAVREPTQRGSECFCYSICDHEWICSSDPATEHVLDAVYCRVQLNFRSCRSGQGMWQTLKGVKVGEGYPATCPVYEKYSY
jgi:hypothetical protein